MIKEEIQTILNCNHDFYGENLKDEDKNGVADEDKFCKKCGHHYIRIISVYRAELFNPDKGYLSPKCAVCGGQEMLDKTDIDSWLQIPYQGTIIYVCPDCISKKVKK